MALPLLVFAGTALGNEHSVELKAGFTQRATLYGGVVGPPGSVKTPAVDHARYPLDALQKEAHERYEQALANCEQDLADWEALTKADQKEISRPGKPILQHFFTTNATMEALAVMLRDNRGVALVFDELTSWVHGMNAYRGGKGGDRQAYLSQWAGTPLKIDRKGQETVFVPRPCIGVVGGVQPDLLKDLADEGGRRDGFVERILWEVSPCPPVRWTDATVPESLLAAIVNLFRRLRLSAADRPVTLSAEARARFVRWFDENAEAVAQASGIVAGIYAKLPLQLARLVLILHGLTHPDAPTRLPVSGASMADAIEVVEYYRQNANLVVKAFGAEQGTGTAGVRDRVERLLRARADDGGGWVTSTAIHAHLGRNVKAAELHASLNDLVDEGRAETRHRPADGGEGGRPAVEWKYVERKNEETKKPPADDEPEAENPTCGACGRNLGADELPCPYCRGEDE